MRAAHSGLLGLLLLAGAASLRAEEIVVIVHPGRASHLDAPELARIYLKQRRHWPGGDAIVPVNHASGSPVRDAFSVTVLARTPQQLSLYWNRQYFHGVLPPATLASDEAVKRFVASEPRAIGYIRASALDESVRVVLRLPVATNAPSR